MIFFLWILIITLHCHVHLYCAHVCLSLHTSFKGCHHHSIIVCCFPHLMCPQSHWPLHSACLLWPFRAVVQLPEVTGHTRTRKLQQQSNDQQKCITLIRSYRTVCRHTAMGGHGKTKPKYSSSPLCDLWPFNPLLSPLHYSYNLQSASGYTSHFSTSMSRYWCDVQFIWDGTPSCSGGIEAVCPPLPPLNITITLLPSEITYLFCFIYLFLYWSIFFTKDGAFVLLTMTFFLTSSPE